MVLKEENEFAISGKQEGSVREETNAVSSTSVMKLRNRHQKPLHPLNHQHPRGRSASRKRSLRGRSPYSKTSRQPCKNFLKGTCTKLPCDCWHPPECQFNKSVSGCKCGTECSFPHWMVEEHPNKRPKKGGDKSAAAIVKDVRQLGCVSQDVEPPESAAISRKGRKVLGPIRQVRFTRAALRQANIRGKEDPSLGKIQVKIPHQRCPHAMKFRRQISKKRRMKDKSDAPAETRGDLPRISISSKKKKTCILFRLPMSGFCWPHPK